VRNRVLKAVTFEGMSPRNTVSNSLIEFHRRMAAGGTENRARLARQIVSAARAETGSRMAVTAKLNMTDGIRGGLQPAGRPVAGGCVLDHPEPPAIE